MAGDRRDRNDWRIQRTAGAALVAVASFLAITRDDVETLSGTLLGFAVVLLGISAKGVLPMLARSAPPEDHEHGKGDKGDEQPADHAPIPPRAPSAGA